MELKILQSDSPNEIVFKLSDFGRSILASNAREREGLGDGRYLPSLVDPSGRMCVAFGRDIYALGVTLYHAVSVYPGSLCVWLFGFLFIFVILS